MREVKSFYCTLVCICQRLSNLIIVVDPCVGRIERTVHDVERQSHFAGKQHSVRG